MKKDNLFRIIISNAMCEFAKFTGKKENSTIRCTAVRNKTSKCDPEHCPLNVHPSDRVKNR